MSKAFVIAGFGLLPLWAAIAFNAYAFLAHSPLFIVAPWAFLAAVPACALTLGLSGLSFVVHTRTSGSAARKSVHAVTFVVGVLVVLAIAGLGWRSRNQGENLALQAEQRVVERIVQSDPAVVAAVGEPKSVSMVRSTLSRSSSLPVEYEVSVKGTSTVYAIVAVTRNGSQRSFKLLCLSPTYFAHREAQKHPCAN